MDIKQRLRTMEGALIAREGFVSQDVDVLRAAVLHIEQLEAGTSANDRISRVEVLVCMLARGILSHEYSKDLCRDGVEAACKALANDGDLQAALVILASNR